MILNNVFLRGFSFQLDERTTKSTFHCDALVSLSLVIGSFAMKIDMCICVPTRMVSYATFIISTHKTWYYYSIIIFLEPWFGVMHQNGNKNVSTLHYKSKWDSQTFSTYLHTYLCHSALDCMTTRHIACILFFLQHPLLCPCQQNRWRDKHC